MQKQIQSLEFIAIENKTERNSVRQRKISGTPSHKCMTYSFTILNHSLSFKAETFTINSVIEGVSVALESTKTQPKKRGNKKNTMFRLF